MSKRKHSATRIAKILLTEDREPEPALPNFKLPTVENILHTNADEMESIRASLAQQQLELLNRRGYLAGAIKSIDEHLDIIDNTLRMIEANQR